MAYRAEIQIALKGARELKAFQQDLDKTAKSVDSLNKYLKDYEVGASGAFNEVRAALQRASDTFDKTIADHKTARQAAEDLARAERAYNNELAKRNRLLREARSTTGFSAAQYGPQLPSGFSTAKGESGVRTALAEDRSIKEINQRRIQERQLLNELIEGDFKRMQKRLDNNDRVFKDKMRKNKEELRNFDKLLQERTQTRARQEKRRRDALGSGIIGGAFPLLFGQGVGASVLGAAGGAAGGLVGGQFGFGLSLVGTAVGQSFDNMIESAAELGKALNPVATDISTITDALGIAGTKTEAYIKALQSTGQESGAAAFAIRKLEELVGSDGVAAFEEFGRESQDLTNQVQKFFTQLQAGLVQVINTLGLLESASEGIERSVDITSARGARGRSPELDKALDALDRERSTSAYGLSSMGIGGLIPAEATEAEKKVLEEYNKLLLKSGDIIDANTIKARQKTAELESELVIAEQRLILERGNNDVLNASVEAALRAIAAEETRLALIEAQGDARKIELVLLNAAAKKLEIDNAIANARSRAATRGGRGGAQEKSKLLSLQRSLVQEEVKRADIALKYAKIVEGEEATLRLTNQYLGERVEKGILIIELERQQALENNKVASDAALINQLYDSRIQTLQDQYGLEQAQNRERLKAIQLEGDLLRLSLERENSAVSRGISRDIENAQARLLNAFGGEAFQQLELQLEQTRRYDDAVRTVSEALEDVNRKLRDTPNDTGLGIEKKNLEERLNMYKELLPVLDQIEQKELRQQQIIAKYGFIVDEVATGFSNAIVGLVKGTETVEQAFARMFENIGRAFIDMATKMLAQRLFLTVLSALGSGGGGGRVGPGLFNLSGGQFGAFAEGGFVTGPTRAIVGEGNQPEYIIPQNKMKESMARYSRGARGSAVIPQNGDTAPNSTSGAAAAAQPIDVRYTVERINSVDYVTADQFQQGMRQAAQQGAKQGEQQTLRRLQMSSSTRRRLGV